MVKTMRLIDADKVREMMENTFDMQDLCLPMHFMGMVVDEVPTVDPVKHGRWIEHGKDDNRCSLCGWGVWVNTNNYCPNCGAKMDEEE